MKHLRLAATVLAMAGLAGCGSNAPRPAPAPGAAAGSEERCAALPGTRLGFATIEEAEHVTRGDQLVPLSKRAMYKILAPKISLDVPAPRDFCRVWAELNPPAGSRIKVQLWLPDEWNRKLLSSGGGGFNGGMSSAALTLHGPTSKGYAGLVSDVGHEDSGFSAEFAQDREQFIDYAHRANHVTIGFARELVKAYYGQPAKRAYFMGGSNGGREALMEARRYPGDFDGIVAGMPAMSFTRLVGISFLWNHQAGRSAPGLEDKLPLVQAAVMKKCDTLDGVKDQVLENPLHCKFDPAELQCKGSDAADCLSTAEVRALRKIYDGPRLRDGTQVFPGQVPGGEGLPGNWNSWIVSKNSVQSQLGKDFLRWMVHGDPDWNDSQFDPDRDLPLALERAAPLVDSDDPELSGFLGKGGKLIIHHGWADAAITPVSTLNYYEALRRKVGAKAARQVRLFMVPGMLHGPGGSLAPSYYDVLDELDRWVEGGPAPERIIATQYESERPFGLEDSLGKPVRTRPLCAWPKLAQYKGSGSADDAANFSCK